jgi:hypothetical protein
MVLKDVYLLLINIFYAYADVLSLIFLKRCNSLDEISIG